MPRKPFRTSVPACSNSQVSAFQNPQMQIYALGAYQLFSFEYNISRVRMTIVQPRIDNLSEYELSASDLLAWAKYQLMPKAEEAFGEYGRQKPGEWCQFCKVKATCKALSDLTFSTVERHPDPKTIAPEEMASRVLPLLDTIKTWVKGVDDYTLEQALNGQKYAGFKLVAGRSVRRITDPEAVMGVAQLAQRRYAHTLQLRRLPAPALQLNPHSHTVGHHQHPVRITSHVRVAGKDSKTIKNPDFQFWGASHPITIKEG